MRNIVRANQDCRNFKQTKIAAALSNARKLTMKQLAAAYLFSESGESKKGSNADCCVPSRKKDASFLDSGSMPLSQWLRVQDARRRH